MLISNEGIKFSVCKFCEDFFRELQFRVFFSISQKSLKLRSAKMSANKVYILICVK